MLHTLPNGVRVVCDPIDGFQTLALSVVAGRGSRWETAENSGWAHLMEHMVFKGAGGRSAREIVEVIEAGGGNINAFTGHERTSFQVRALKGGLPLAMEVTTDLVRRPTLDEADLVREKGVIGQEIAEAADTPDDQVFEMAQRASFGDTPLGRSILGTVETVNAASRDDLAGFAGGLYSPDRLIVSASGAVDEDELLRLAEASFGDMAPCADAAEPEAGAFLGGTATRAAPLEQAHLVFMLPACGAADEDYFALRVFAEILGGGMSSRLFQEVRENRGLAYNIDAFAETYADIGALGVYAGCAAKDAAEAAQLTAEQILGLAERPGEDEVGRARAQLKGGIFMSRESALSRAEQAASQCLVFGRLLSPQEIEASIDAVTVADVRRIGARILTPGKAGISVLGPKTAKPAAAAFSEALAA